MTKDKRIMSPKPIEVFSLSDAARRLSVCRMTLVRHVKKAGILPDVVLVEGSRGLRSPLYVLPRLKEIQSLMTDEPVRS